MLRAGKLLHCRTKAERFMHQTPIDTLCASLNLSVNVQPITLHQPGRPHSRSEHRSLFFPHRCLTQCFELRKGPAVNQRFLSFSWMLTNQALPAPSRETSIFHTQLTPEERFKPAILLPGQQQPAPFPSVVGCSEDYLQLNKRFSFGETALYFTLTNPKRDSSPRYCRQAMNIYGVPTGRPNHTALLKVPYRR